MTTRTPSMRALGAAVLALAGALMLAGCSSAPRAAEPAQATTPAASAAATRAPVGTSAAPVVVSTPGPVPTGATVAAGFKTVTLSDGSTYAIDPAVPLPEKIKADLAKPIQVFLAETASKKPVSSASVEGEAAMVDAQTGRKTVVLNRQWRSLDGNHYNWLFFAGVAGDPDGVAKSTRASSKATLLANLDAWMAAHGGAAKFDVIDATGGK